MASPQIMWCMLAHDCGQECALQQHSALIAVTMCSATPAPKLEQGMPEAVMDITLSTTYCIIVWVVTLCCDSVQIQLMHTHVAKSCAERE